MIYFLLFRAFFVFCRLPSRRQRLFVFNHELGSGIEDP